MPDEELLSESTQEDLSCTVIYNTLSVQDIKITGVVMQAATSFPVTVQSKVDEKLPLERDGDVSFTQTKLCPLCAEAGHREELKLYQINFEEAVYLCTKAQCLYPFSISNLHSSIIQRPFTQMKFPRKKRKKNRQQLSCSNLKSLVSLDKNKAILSHPLPSINFAKDSTDVFEFLDEYTSDNLSDPKSTPVNIFGSNFMNLDSKKLVTDVSWINTNETINLENQSKNLDSFCSESPTEIDPVPPSSETENVSSNTFQNNEASVSTIADLIGNSVAQVTDTDCLGLMLDYDRVSSVIAPQTTSNSFDYNYSAALINSKQFEIDLPDPYFLKGRNVLQWQNENSLCWLDTLLHCIVYSICIRTYINLKIEKEERKKSIFYRLCSVYDYVQDEVNVSSADKNPSDLSALSDFSVQSEMLNEIRREVFELLQMHFSFKQGVDQSVHKMFSNFLSMDTHIKSLFITQLRWEFECSECDFKRIKRETSEVVSFPSTSAGFHPRHATFDRCCMSCSAPNQVMNMIIEICPPCLMMHFQRGLSHNRFKAMDFAIQNHLYCVTAVIQFIASPSKHFVVWIRNCKNNLWMCCDDVKAPTCAWKRGAPKISPNEIHLILWERQRQVQSDNILELSLDHLSFINNDDAMLSGDEFPNEILVGTKDEFSSDKETTSEHKGGSSDLSWNTIRSPVDCKSSSMIPSLNANLNSSCKSIVYPPNKSQSGYVFLRHCPPDSGVLRMRVTNTAINLNVPKPHNSSDENDLDNFSLKPNFFFQYGSDEVDADAAIQSENTKTVDLGSKEKKKTRGRKRSANLKHNQMNSDTSEKVTINPRRKRGRPPKSSIEKNGTKKVQKKVKSTKENVGIKKIKKKEKKVKILGKENAAILEPKQLNLKSYMELKYSDQLKSSATPVFNETHYSNYDSENQVDLDMLAQACEELKSSDPDSDLKKSKHEDDLPCSPISIQTPVPCNAVILPLPHRNVQTACFKKLSTVLPSFNSSMNFPQKSDFRSRSKLVNYNNFAETFERKQVFKLTSYRKAHLKRIRSETIRNRLVETDRRCQSFRNFSKSPSVESSEVSSEISGLSDIFPDVEIFSNCSDFSDVLTDFDLNSNL